MKNIFLLLCTLLSIYSFGQNKTITDAELIGCWTDSREENIRDSGIRVFRPCDYKKFPISRYRYSINLGKNHECSWYRLAPNDAHYMEEGEWAFNQETRMLSIFNSDHERIKDFVIESIAKNMMKIKK